MPKTNTDYWQNKRLRNVERDKENLKIYKKQGWKVLVIWECEIKDTINLKRKLVKFLAE